MAISPSAESCLGCCELRVVRSAGRGIGKRFISPLRERATTGRLSATIRVYAWDRYWLCRVMLNRSLGFGCKQRLGSGPI